MCPNFRALSVLTLSLLISPLDFGALSVFVPLRLPMRLNFRALSVLTFAFTLP
jgi:hypothetical protein